VASVYRRDTTQLLQTNSYGVGCSDCRDFPVELGYPLV
jgi:hypothetical protein